MTNPRQLLSPPMSAGCREEYSHVIIEARSDSPVHPVSPRPWRKRRVAECFPAAAFTTTALLSNSAAPRLIPTAAILTPLMRMRQASGTIKRSARRTGAQCSASVNEMSAEVFDKHSLSPSCSHDPVSRHAVSNAKANIALRRL